MTTLTITIPIAPGAKTCEGCPHVGFAFGICGVFDKTISNELDRLPECLAAERVKVGECWRIYDADGDIWEDCVSPAAASREIDMCGMQDGAKIVHVTRYRRRAK